MRTYMCVYVGKEGRANTNVKGRKEGRKERGREEGRKEEGKRREGGRKAGRKLVFSH